MTKFYQVLVSTPFNWGWCLATFAWGAFWLSRLIYQRRGLARDLRAALAAIAGIKGHAEFRSRRRQIGERIAQLRSLKHAWSEFQECLIDLPGDEAKGVGAVLANTRAPRAYFSPETIIEPYIHTRFYNTVPNHLTGLGILGTFVGLAAGIGLAQAELVGGGTIAEMQLGLRHLLSGASLAFVTSIVGLVLAIMFLVCERVLLSSLVKMLDAWADFLEANLKLVTSEDLAHGQLRELKTQTRLLENFTNDLAVAVASALDTRLNERLVPTLNQVVAAIGELRDKSMQTSDQVLQSVVSQLGDVVAGATKTEVQALSKVVTDVTGSLSATVGTLQGAQSTIQAATDEAAERMQQVLGNEMRRIEGHLSTFATGLDTQLHEAISTVARGLEEAGKSGSAGLLAAADRLQVATESLTRLVDAAAEGRAELEQGVKGLSSAVASINSATSAFGAAASPIRESAANFRAASDQVSRAGELLGAVGQRFDGTAQSLRATSETMQRAWAEYRERFESVDKALGNLTNNLHQFVENFVSKASGFVGEMDTQLARSVSALAGAAQELEEAVESLREANE